MDENHSDAQAVVDEDGDLDELAAELEHETKLEGYRSWTRFIAFVAVAVVAGVVALLALVFTGGGNAAKCEAAVRAMVPAAMAGVDQSDAKKPSACKGLSDAELERIGEKVMGSMFSDAFAGLADAFGGES